MKRIALLTLFASLFAGNCFAQTTDPLNQSPKKVNDSQWSSEQEQVITKKKKNDKQVVISNNQNANIETSSKPSIEILNSCPEEISVELISLIGNRASQTVNITIKYTNHDINKRIHLREFLAYNEEGDEFYKSYPTNDRDTFTDVAVKVQWEIGQMLPSKNSKITALSFDINDCAIEMKNIPIEWR